MDKIVVIVAGGSGSRMGSELPKQFIKVHGLPVLMHTILAFHRYDSSMEIRVVLPEGELERWKSLCVEYNFKIPHNLFTGGKKRFYSVRNGLSNIREKKLVAVHDGVRPLVSRDTITRCFEAAEKKGAVVPVIPLRESLRKLQAKNSVAENRDYYRLVQTPGVFHSDILLKAYDTEYREFFTDDASVVEAAGYKIHLTEGNPENIKLTSPADILMAESLMGD
jgi:2-C-methyl-D-erythritol 4-phosphate cytidylyltransferase